MQQALQNVHYMSVSRPLVLVMAGALSLQVVNILLIGDISKAKLLQSTVQRASVQLTHYDNTIHFCNRSASCSCFSLPLPLARHAPARSTRTRSLGTLSRAQPHGKHRNARAGSVTARRPRDGRPPPCSPSGAVGDFLALVLALALARQRIAITESCSLFCCRSLRR